MSAVLLFGIFFALLFLNVPIAMSLGVSSIITTMAVKPAMMSTIAANLYSSTNTYVLLAIPFFILAGNIMDVSGISVRLIKTSLTPLSDTQSTAPQWSASSLRASLRQFPAPARLPLRLSAEYLSQQ